MSMRLGWELRPEGAGLMGQGKKMRRVMCSKWWEHIEPAVKYIYFAICSIVIL